MLYAEEKELEAIRVSERIPCSATGCDQRTASWRVEHRFSGKKVEMCAWCVLYSGTSKWAHEHDEDVASFGPLCEATAKRTSSARTHIPQLDERHRLEPLDAEKALMGVVFTSRILRSKLRPIAKVHLKGQDGEPTW